MCCLMRHFHHQNSQYFNNEKGMNASVVIESLLFTTLFIFLIYTHFRKIIKSNKVFEKMRIYIVKCT